VITILLAAHQGEEFVLVLPAIMLVGAYFALRWANSGDKPAEDEADEHASEEAVSDLEEETIVQSRR
jgi:hypothetical protein